MFKAYDGNDVSPIYTYLPRWGWCRATYHTQPEVVALVGRWTVSRLGWGADYLTWDQLSPKEKQTLMRGNYRKA
jgi:hypothetical protein